MSTSSLKYESLIDGTSMTVNSESSSSTSLLGSCPLPAMEQSHAKIPFSWEKEPGVPKPKIHSVRTDMARSISKPILNDHHHHHHHLVRPPPILASKPLEAKHKKKGKSDPFVAAMVECTKHEKSKERTSIFSWMRSCSTSGNEVIVPHSKLLDRPKNSRSNQVLHVDTTTRISIENLRKYGSTKHFGKENREQQPKALEEWVNNTLLKGVV